MSDLFIVTCEILLLGLLIVGAAFDIAKFRLPNWLTAATALLALPWLALSAPVWPDLGLHLAAGLLFLAVGILALRFDLMGGGDVKWLAALAIWVGLGLDLVRLLMLTGFAGGILAGIMLLLGRFGVTYGVQDGKRHLPYGVAIALAGLDFWFRRGHLGQQIAVLWG
ncbi:prepilin peptidase [Dongia rigui]|uniref:Prepilin peptidase n=1 Tax=Dongia rigui TaxID=940149 RepID=A0ABU5DTW3_9PROT|nr:prepilin peptidase [Dongia rigui]MDY0870773.1 prepilin peptidase [Dongia rigui]